MTQNQIAYHNALENERHNKAVEAENARHARVDEAIKQRSNELSERYNEIQREHFERQDAINATHYQTADKVQALLAEETMRSNVQSEAIRRQQNAINAAGVAETTRHAKVMEGIESTLAENTLYKTQAEVSYTTANTGLVQAKTRTEGYQPQYILNQSDLNNAKRITEGYKQTEIESSTWRNYMSSIGEALGWLGRVVPMIK